jgi:outer membrane protein assembly factor BamB
MAVSPDGKYLVASPGGGSVALWDLQARKLVWQCVVHDRTHIPSGAFLPGGKLIAAWGEESISGQVKGREITIRLLELATGKVARSFAIGRYIKCVTVSADGKYLLAGGEGNPLKLWNVAEGKEIRTFQGGEDTASLALSADGKFALSGGLGRGHVRLWEVATGKECWAVQGHTCWVPVVAFSPNGKHGLSAGDDGHIRIWDFHSGNLVRSIQVGRADERFHAIVNAAAFTVTGRYVVVTAQGEPLQLWEVATGKLALTFQTDQHCRELIVVTPDGRYVLTTALEIWDIRSGKKVGCVAEPSKP